MRSLKKRKIDRRGRERAPQYRTVPVPAALIESLDLVFNLRARQRHGFGVAMVTAGRPLPIHVLSRLMGHASTRVTEIYLQMVGEEQRRLVMEAWES